jgi:hypothetical protein
LAGILLGVGLGTTASAEDVSAGPTSWADTLKISSYLDAGITANPYYSTGLNFGRLFTDKANAVLLNQVSLIAERPIDSSSKDLDFGFKFQFMAGTDARYTHFIGELDRVGDERVQLDIVEANLQAHLPVLTDGGIDVKAGQFVTLEGAEVIDPRGNFFYSHSYIFNFGVPLKHTGILTTTHVNPNLDVILGITSGVNTTLGGGDNNDRPSFHGGFALNGLFDGKVSALLSTHIGPEIPEGTAGVHPNRDLRYLNDATITWKVSDALTSITDLNLIRDDGFHAWGYGVAQYLIYQFNELISGGARAEIWRDANGFFVGAFPGNTDFLNAEVGKPATVIGGGQTTYLGLTLGVNIKPPVPKAIDGFVIRPEVRYDRSLTGTHPFGTTDRPRGDQFTIGLDFVLPFTLLPFGG